MTTVSAERPAFPLLALRLFLVPLLALTLSSCQKKSVTIQSKLGLLEQAETNFRSGNYAEAATLFQACLQKDVSPGHRDRALFQLGLAHLFPDSPVYDLQVGCNLLAQVVEQLPESPLKPPAQIILALQNDQQNLRKKIQEIDKEAETWRGQAAKLEDELRGLVLQLEALSSESQVLQSHLKVRQTRIEALLRDLEKETTQSNTLQSRLEQLQKEMESLKQIDLRGKPPGR